MSRKWPAPVDVPAAEDELLSRLVQPLGGWQPVGERPSTVRSQWLLWQAWALGRWNELEHGFRQPDFNPAVRFAPCDTLTSVGPPFPVLNPIVTPGVAVHGWTFWLMVHPTPPNVWDAFLAACGPSRCPLGPSNDPVILARPHALEVLWSRWPYHARHRLAFQEMLRRFEQGRAHGWFLRDHPGLDEGLTEGLRLVDTARDRQGRFAPLCHHFADLAACLQRWGVAWNEAVGDPDGSPRLWRLIQGQWMFLHPADVERDGWLGRLLVNDADLWDGPGGIRTFWEVAFQQDAELLLPAEDLEGLAAIWATVQRVGDGARLRALAAGLPTEERPRRRL